MPVHGLASHCVLPCAVGTCVCVGGGGGEKLYLQEVTQLLSMFLLHAISINAETMVHVYGSNLSAIFGLRHSTCVVGPPSTALSGGGVEYECNPLDLLLGKSKYVGAI